MIYTDGFVSSETKASFDNFMAQWSQDPGRVKTALQKILNILLANKGTVLYFHARPGVSYSLRASVAHRDPKHRPYYAIVDIVEEPHGNRWLSICFYADTVSDPEDMGNLIPKGLLHEDGYCFDVDSCDEQVLSYLKDRINEAYNAYISAQAPSP